MMPPPNSVTARHVDDYAATLPAHTLPEPPRAARPRRMRPDVRPRLTPEQRQGLRQWLLEGLPMAQIVAAARAIWQLEPAATRSAVRRLRRRWAYAAGRADYLAHLWFAKGQREHLFAKVMRQVKEDLEPRQFIPVLRLAQQLLKERDDLFAQVRTHRRACRRDASPDLRAARRPRRDEVTLPRAEWQQRWEHYRNLLWAEWQQARPTVE